MFIAETFRSAWVTQLGSGPLTVLLTDALSKVQLSSKSLDLHSGSPWVESRACHRVSWRDFRVFPQHYQKNVRILLSTYQESVPTGTAVYEHAQDFVAIDELPLNILIAFPQCTFSLHATRNAWYFPFLSTSKTICRFYQQQSRSLPVANSPPHRTRDAFHTAGIISWSVVCTLTRPRQLLSKSFPVHSLPLHYSHGLSAWSKIFKSFIFM